MDYFAAVPISLGGPDIICQCDESLFVHKAKYNHGRRPSDQVWVFGIADTSFKPARFYVEIVAQRDSETLFPIVVRMCKPGTKIHTDCWAAYHAIQRELGFSHGMVNHKFNFVAPGTGVHTQNVESLWNRLKRKIKAMCGIKRTQLPGYLAEMMFKNEHKNNVLMALLKPNSD